MAISTQERAAFKQSSGDEQPGAKGGQSRDLYLFAKGCDSLQIGSAKPVSDLWLASSCSLVLASRIVGDDSSLLTISS